MLFPNTCRKRHQCVLQTFTPHKRPRIAIGIPWILGVSPVYRLTYLTREKITPRPAVIAKVRPTTQWYYPSTNMGLI